MINQVGITAIRQEKYDFSIPYAYAQSVTVVRTDDQSIHSFDDLSGKSAAQTVMSNCAKAVEEHGTKIVSTGGFNESVLEALAMCLPPMERFRGRPGNTSTLMLRKNENAGGTVNDWLRPLIIAGEAFWPISSWPFALTLPWYRSR